MIFKKRKILNIGYYLYGIKTQILKINCDKLLFLKKYKNIYKILLFQINDIRIYNLITILLKFRIKYIFLKIEKQKRKIYLAKLREITRNIK